MKKMCVLLTGVLLTTSSLTGCSSNTQTDDSLDAGSEPGPGNADGGSDGGSDAAPEPALCAELPCCGFEPPLEAMRRALDGSNPQNAGFSRPEAFLQVVILSNEDDCSVSDAAMFGDHQGDLSSELGPLVGFRCFEFGVTCEPAEDPRAPGQRTNCVPRSDSPYMPDVQEYVDFLKGLEADPSRVAVSVIGGDPEPVEVEIVATGSGPRASLQPSCVGDAQAAIPAVRLDAFVRRFPQRNIFSSVCRDDYSNAFALITNPMTGPIPERPQCMFAVIHDVDPDTVGVQHECSVALASAAGRTELALCDNAEAPEASSNTPCYSIRDDEQGCRHIGNGLSLYTFLGETVPVPGEQLDITCLRD